MNCTHKWENCSFVGIFWARSGALWDNVQCLWSKSECPTSSSIMPSCTYEKNFLKAKIWHPEQEQPVALYWTPMTPVVFLVFSRPAVTPARAHWRPVVNLPAQVHPIGEYIALFTQEHFKGSRIFIEKFFCLAHDSQMFWGQNIVSLEPVMKNWDYLLRK